MDENGSGMRSEQRAEAIDTKATRLNNWFITSEWTVNKSNTHGNNHKPADAFCGCVSKTTKDQRKDKQTLR